MIVYYESDALDQGFVNHDVKHLSMLSCLAASAIHDLVETILWLGSNCSESTVVIHAF